jgi:hypothetical protein
MKSRIQESEARSQNDKAENRILLIFFSSEFWILTPAVRHVY